MAVDLARTELAPTNPLRLSLALNFSVFYYDILDAPDLACDLAKQAFYDAINELDSLTEESYSESIPVIQLLHDNLVLWTSSGLEGRYLSPWPSMEDSSCVVNEAAQAA